MTQEKVENSLSPLSIKDTLNFYAEIGRLQFLAKVEVISCDFEKAVTYFKLAEDLAYKFAFKAIKNNFAWCEKHFLKQFPEFKVPVYQAKLTLELSLLRNPAAQENVTVDCPRECNQVSLAAITPWEQCPKNITYLY